MRRQLSVNQTGRLPQYTGAAKAERTHYNQNSDDSQKTVNEDFRSWLSNLSNPENAPSGQSASNKDMLNLLYDIYMSSRVPSNLGQHGYPNPYNQRTPDNFNHFNNSEAQYAHSNFPVSHHFNDRERLYDSSGNYNQPFHDESMRHHHPNDHYVSQSHYDGRYELNDRRNRKPRTSSDGPNPNNNYQATIVNKTQTASDGSNYNRTLQQSGYQGYTETSKQYDSSISSNSDSLNLKREQPTATANDKDNNNRYEPMYGLFDEYNAPRYRSVFNYHVANVNNRRQSSGSDLN